MNTKNLFLTLFFIFTITTFIGCGGSGGGSSSSDDGGDDSENNDPIDEDIIKITDGMAIVGTFNGDAIEIAEEDVTVDVKVDDTNENGIFDEEELMGIFVFSSDDYIASGGERVLAGITMAQASNLPAIETLNDILYGYAQLPDIDDSTHIAESGNFYLTQFSTGEEDTVTGLFELVLEGGEGEFTVSFSGELIFE